MMTKRGKYYFDLDAVRSKEYGETSKSRWATAMNGGTQPAPPFSKISENSQVAQKIGQTERFYNPLGKNAGTVWSIPSQPYPGAHYSTFPEALVERMMLCSTKPGDRVLDPFGGSGTVGRVAIRLQRNPVLLDLAYHDQQSKRMDKIQLEMVGTKS
jgi:site-specific DNA-methyltransferase (cytosine-N4-specific)